MSHVVYCGLIRQFCRTWLTFWDVVDWAADWGFNLSDRGQA